MVSLSSLTGIGSFHEGTEEIHRLEGQILYLPCLRKTVQYIKIF